MILIIFSPSAISPTALLGGFGGTDVFKGVHVKWHRTLKNWLSPQAGGEKRRPQRRILLQLEELETRALLSASGVTPAPVATAPATTTTAPASSWTAQTNLAVTPAVGTAFSGYTPAQLQTAYGSSSLLTTTLANGQKNNGAGETIAIVDAYNDPNIHSDLNTFDAKYGLAAANLTVVNQSGSTTNLPTADTGWGVEESLDVEWAHAMAPGAKIVLVEASSNSLSDLLAAVNTATSKMGANVVSMSWGGSEFAGETSYDSAFTAPNVTYVASAGDSSAYFGPEWPASSANVLAVGGTSLKLNSSNTISSETAWNASFSWAYGLEGGGGGVSSYEAQPNFQANIPNYGGRATPDVSFDANPGTGVSIYDSAAGGWGYVGGTSVGAPAWAGITALADQRSVANGNGSLSTSQVENALYGVYHNVGGSYSSTFHDITKGNNGYSAGTGYDLATGLGTPNVGNIVSLLGNITPTPALRSTTVHTASSPVTGSPSHHTSPAVMVISGASSDSGAGSFTLSAASAPLNATSAGTPVSGNSNVLAAFNLESQGTPVLLSEGGGLDGSSASATRDAAVFGASGWNGSGASWRLSSLGFRGSLVNQVADNLAGGSSEEDEGTESDSDTPSLDALAGDSSAPAEADGADAGSGEG
jgi:subtilase family serine protease